MILHAITSHFVCAASHVYITLYDEIRCVAYFFVADDVCHLITICVMLCNCGVVVVVEIVQPFSSGHFLFNKRILAREGYNTYIFSDQVDPYTLYERITAYRKHNNESYLIKTTVWVCVINEINFNRFKLFSRFYSQVSLTNNIERTPKKF